MVTVDVVFVEHDEKLHTGLEPSYRSLFESLGYSPRIEWASDERGARTAIRKVSPQVLICDLTFGRGAEIGLEIIRKLKTDYPDILVIGTSRADYSPRKVFEKLPSFDLFIDKARFLDTGEPYFSWIRSELKKRLTVNPDIQVVDFDRVISEFFEEKFSREILSIVRQATFAGHGADPRMRPDRVRLAALAGGLSGSRVFRLSADNQKSGFVSVPAVLKISQREFAEQELDNFERLVRWGLPYIMRVDILGHGLTKHFGGICYSFVLSDDHAFSALADVVMNADWPKVRQVIDKIFGTSSRRWYSDNLVQLEENINRRYRSRYFRGSQNMSASDDTFRELAHQMFGARFDPVSMKIGQETFPTPQEVLFGRPNGNYMSCICHGDLNANNIIVADNGEIIFIDFQESGRGHVFEDFVTFESSIRLHAAMNFAWTEVLSLERKIGMGEDPSSLPEPYRLIAAVRSQASRNFPRENVLNYHYAVAAYNFRLLRAQRMSAAQKCRCVCAIIASVAALVTEL